MASFRELKKQRTRTRLAGAAVDLLIEGGVEAATIQAITAQAEVSPRTFHNYFESREDALMFFAKETGKEFVVGMETCPRVQEPIQIAAYAIERIVVGQSSELLTTNRVLAIGQITTMLGAGAALDTLRKSFEDKLLGTFIRVCREMLGVECTMTEASLIAGVAMEAARNSIERLTNACLSPMVTSTPASLAERFDPEAFSKEFEAAIAFCSNGFRPTTSSS